MHLCSKARTMKLARKIAPQSWSWPEPLEKLQKQLASDQIKINDVDI